MSDNRVEELEAKVRDLEATVEGLTDELVESKVRLRELENAVDDELGFEKPVNIETDVEDETESVSTSAEATKSQEVEDTDDQEAESDIIIA
ncbi:bZIP transcription factor [Halorhabdus sp. SVX81]|uniref:DUF7518 family protein n=1 Tax=Halorhabdus sp. SVX81 TaxID=2978283 RepID=UPI0023DC4103|nr:bZIP transcription factor [Halorhabdus sp. SVX81]